MKFIFEYFHENGEKISLMKLKEKMNWNNYSFGLKKNFFL